MLQLRTGKSSQRIAEHSRSEIIVVDYEGARLHQQAVLQEQSVAEPEAEQLKRDLHGQMGEQIRK